ncbi:MAG: hypothetical protein L6R45_03910 [Anaerolineae bacterium]|nr:hypothetical protein [Anaerolineae bacterium]
MSKAVAFPLYRLINITFLTLITTGLLFFGLSFVLPQPAHAQGPVINIGDLPPGKVVTITFRAAITTSLSAGATQVCNQATISGTNFATIVTDDPTTPAANDPTCTPLDLPAVSIAAGTSPSETGPTNGSFTISLDNPAPVGGLTVNYNLTGSTATLSTDYSLAAGTNISSLTGSSFTIAAGQSSGVITVVPVDDQVDDDGETVQFNLAAGSGYTLGATSTATLTIADNDTRGVTITESGGSTNVTEGGATDTYTIRLDTVPTATVTIAFNPGSQLDALTSLVFQADPTALNPQTVTVTATDDTVVEGDHTGTISHSASGGGYDGTTIADVTANITDNDIAYTLAAGQVSVAEGDAGATPLSFTLTRTGDITRSSSVDFSLGGTATNGVDYNNVAPAGGAVSFGAGVTQTQVTLGVLGDFIDEPNETVSVSLTNPTGTNASGTSTISGSPAATTILDDDSAGVSVTPTSLTISEPNTTGVFTIALTSQPTATVTIGLSTSSDECTFPASASLTNLNWDTGVTVTVTAVDDFVTDGPQPCLIVTALTSSADPVYNNTFDPANINVTVNDNDVPGFTITPTGGLTTTETGGAATFTVRLSTEPTAGVTLTLTNGDTTEGTVSPASLSFTTLDWNSPQTVTITGVNDDLDDGDQAYSIITNNPTSSDPDYNGAGANPADVNVTNLDDDTAGFIVSAISGDTSENGITATFTIRLTSQPTATVTVPISSTDASEGTVSPLNLSFTTLDWNVPQTVTVTGVDDLDLDGDINYSVQMGPTVSSDPLYDNRTPGPVAVVNLDNDVPPVSPIFLPLIVRNSVTAPDLVIDNLTASSSGVTLVIRNQGNAPVVGAFWVDVYFNPTSTPTVNRRWQDIASRGQVWGIQGAGLPLDPGESLTLTSGGAFYFPQFSSTPPLPVGAHVFALVDSVDFSTTFGAVRESSEANNLFGPVLSTAGNSKTISQSETLVPEGLPDRE